MTFDSQTLMTVFLIVTASSMLQGTVGFGSGMLGIPLMVLAGVSLPQAVTINMIGAITQNAWGTFHLRKEIVYQDVWWPIAIRIAALPVGAYLLWVTNSWGQETIKQIIGLLLLVIVVVQLLIRVEPRDKVAPGWMWLAFLLSGGMSGYCGMGGPAMVLWVMAHRWSQQRSKAFLFIVFLVGMFPLSVLLVFLFGEEVIQAGMVGGLAIPFAWLGMTIGLRMGANLPKKRLRRLSYGLLIFIATSAILQPLVF